jgi:ubiquitin conjugation factor E4 B
MQQEAAEKSGFDIVWLKALAEELKSENSKISLPTILNSDSKSDTALYLNAEVADRLLIGRLELDPQAMS